MWQLALGLVVSGLATNAVLWFVLARGRWRKHRVPEANANPLLGAIAEASSDAIVSMDERLRIAGWNSGAERIFGYSRDEAIGQPAEMLMRPEDRQAFAEIIHAIKEGGARPEAFQAVRVRKDGSHVMVSISAFPVGGDGPAVAGAVMRDVTEQNRASRQLDSLFNLSLDFVCIAGLGGYFKRVNPTFERSLGYTMSELLASSFLALLHPDDLAAGEAAVRKLASGESVARFRSRARCKDGTYRWLLWNAVAVPDEGLIYAVGQDISEEEELRRALSTNQDRLAAFLQHAPLGMFINDMDGRYILANPAFAREVAASVDLSSDGIVGSRFEDLMPVEMAERLKEIDSRVIATGLPVSEVFQGSTRQGRRWYATTKFPVYRANGDIEAVGGIVSDITVQKETANALSVSEARLSSILDHAPTIIVMKDRDGRYVTVNRKFADLLGRPASELIGHGIADLFPEELAEVVRAHDDHVFESRQAHEWEEGLLFPQVGGRLFLASKFPVFDSDGTVLCVCSIAIDITERKNVEVALEAARNEADRANQAKSEFLSRMSHELRTPLNVILGFGQVLELDPLEPPQLEAVDHILKAGRHLLDLIDEILDISRIEAGRVSLSIEPVLLNEILLEVVALMKPSADQRRIALMSEETEDSLYCMADRQRIKQVLLNLLSNAIKYNHDGGRVTISASQRSGDFFQIRVADTGPGISAENLARLFTPFDRLGAEASDVQGTGLGLALSKRLVDAMGGEIGVETNLGTGSTFWVALPSTAVPELEETQSLSARDAWLTPSRALSQRTVLYVEDNLASINLMERLFSRAQGSRLLVAMQGSIGLELALDHQPDLIFLDLHLPDMSGVDVLRSLKSNPATSSLPVVILSADASPGQIRRILSEGAHSYVTKPFDVKQLLALVDAILIERTTGDGSDKR